MEEKFQIQINGSIEGYRLTKEFINLLETLNKDYFDEFMKFVKRQTLDCYRSIEPRYINDMLYRRMNQYHKVLCELLDRCAPHGYYFGLCNENIRGVYSGDTYGFWKEEEKEKADNLRTLVEKKILEYQEKSNNFSKSSFRWVSNYYDMLRSENLEFKLKVLNNRQLLHWYETIIRQYNRQG